MKRALTALLLLLPLTLPAGRAAAGPHEDHGHGSRFSSPQGEKPPEPPAPTPPPIPGEQPPPIEGEQPPPIEQRDLPEEDAKTNEAGEKEAKKDPAWDVNNPPGTWTEVTIDTAEGTWMSLDVSPDGKTVVFDLLGDLYSVPIGGGEATVLTHTIAWEMQPRFSPDGKQIAFTSDQGGGDNVWVMDRDGKNPRQVTKETFRLLNSPSWAPDGEYIVARKHFTAQRSLGAGEMWLYHKSGGEGLQLTTKPNDQKDAGEPVFSPDGRYLYYSQDTTPGPVFEYNKDPNGEIFVIQRLDRKTGKTARYVTGAGGAVRPTPSPDGKQLAFIRRVRGKSVLHLFDLRSGDVRPLWDGLDRDMQETWSIHGLYPGMAWTPDSKSVVLWAGGKIRRVEVASKKVADIPFHVASTRKVAQAVRFPIQVAPDRFDVKMLRWVEVAPKGDRVVYQALGYLWIRDLPNGTPRRLTRQDDHFEFYPSFSRDGRSVVYTTWDDRKLGTVRVVSAGGGEGKVVTDQPGHYVEPAFTPDGKQVVYRKTGGGFVRTPAWSLEQGIYRVPAGGGTPVRVTEDGAGPHFGVENDRVYLFSFGGDKRQLISIGLDGSEPRTHFQGENVSEFKVSPDGRWLAFADHFNAYVVPFVSTGKAVDLSPKTGAIPVRKVSRDAGAYLHWSGDSKALHWSLGPELYTRALKDAFAYLAGAPDPLPEPPAAGVNIGFQEKSDRPSGTVALVGARIVTMKDGAIVLEGNRIRAVGPSSQVQVPAGARRIDVKGKTILPGLIDVHWHGAFGNDGIVSPANWVPYASLAYGVTTLHDPSNDTETVFAAAELARAGRITAPRIFSTGTILYGATTPFTAMIESLDDARSHLRRMKAVGAWSVKSYNQPRRDQRQQVLAAARELEMMVVPEGGSLFEHNMTMVVDGHTGIEHSIPVAKIYKDVVQLWSGTEVGYTPTLIVGYGGLWGENYWYATTEVWKDPRLSAFVPREILDERARRRPTVPEEEWGHFNNARIAAQLRHAGVEVQVGAHGQREGLAAHWELWMFVQGGMTPHEALQAATIDGARYLGLDRDLGSLEPGKLADLVVLSADPLADIRNTVKIDQVVLNGRVYDGVRLDRIGNDPQKRPPFYWEVPVPASGPAAP
jgi:imidazolonepropionase-like amidohydrolase/Tol biopolymer transport system component